MPAPTAPLLGFVLGVLFAWLARERLGRGDDHGRNAFIVVSLFGLLVFAPIAGYFLAFAPDWSYAYFVDSQRLPGVVDSAWVLVDAASVPLGFAALARHAPGRRMGPLMRLVVVPSAVAVGFVLLSLPRLGVDASYAQYHGDFGRRPVSGSPLGFALLWMTLVLVSGALVTGVWLRRSSRAAERD